MLETTSFGPWKQSTLFMRLLGAPRRYRARYRCDGPPLARRSWKFDGYEWEASNG